MAARDELRWEENLVAAIGGLGLLLAILGGLFIGFDDSAGDTAGLLAIAGLGLIVVAFVIWFVLLQPWERFDDLQTPYFTGHHHEEDHEEAGEVDVAAEMIIEPDAPSLTKEPVAEAVVADSTVETEAVKPPEPTTPVEQEEEVAAPAEVTEPDDLREIEGIGPKAAEALNMSGITTFAQIAAMSPEDLERIVKEEQKVRIVGSTSVWVRQAILAAAGNEAALDDLKVLIKNGVLYDDLTIIEGIDSNVQDVLNEGKVRSYDELAAASAEELEEILSDAGLSGLDFAEWPAKAQEIVDKIYQS